jgi:hypothetical protein
VHRDRNLLGNQSVNTSVTGRMQADLAAAVVSTCFSKNLRETAELRSALKGISAVYDHVCSVMS